MTTVRPALDPELRALLADMPLMTRLDHELLAQFRQLPSAPVEALLEGRRIDHREITVEGEGGARITLSVFSPSGAGADADAGEAGAARDRRAAGAPCVLWMHGGGMVMGDRFSQIDIPLEWLDRFGAVVVSVEYRLAPEAGGTTPVDDCYRSLLWVEEHAEELGVDRSRIVVAGVSAGGGLAAGVTLMARDRGVPAVAAQMLVCPMLDHRNDTASSRQYSGGPGVWTREMNEFGWRSLLGGLRGAEVPGHVSPAVAEDLSGLPTTYVDAGSAEVFRDEVVTYATRIWESGGQAELHVWAGGCHGFDALYPRAHVSAEARRTRNGWLARVLSPAE
ncbi:alpha/beta hydrolase [Streptomyces sp. NPDC003483]